MGSHQQESSSISDRYGSICPLLQHPCRCRRHRRAVTFRGERRCVCVLYPPCYRDSVRLSPRLGSTVDKVNPRDEVVGWIIGSRPRTGEPSWMGKELVPHRCTRVLEN
ncbi:hypothetical protein JMJ77_0014676, partial [Colletotrichum scovillei]